MDWQKAAADPAPAEPELTRDSEHEARRAIGAYKPGLLDKAFKRAERKQETLQDQLEVAKQEDVAGSRKIPGTHSGSFFKELRPSWGPLEESNTKFKFGCLDR